MHAGEVAHQLYAQVTWRWHTVYLGIVMVYDETDPANRVHCRLAWSHPDAALNPANSTGWAWVDKGGLTGLDFIPLNAGVPGGPNPFDSHLCYAAPPVHTPDGERLYYMGSNGPHTGSRPHRNASLGLAMLRTDGYAGMSGSGLVTTTPIVVEGEFLTLTVDVLASSSAQRASVAISAPSVPGMELGDCLNITHNTTDGKVAFRSGATFRGLLGQNVTLVLELNDAVVYTIGWSS